MNTLKVDYLGAVVSFLCLVHCLATPLVFMVKACSITCCVDAPVWWKLIDYFFLMISFGAVYFGVKGSTKKWIKNALWFSWVILMLTIVNESLGVVQLPEHIIYVPAFFLIGLHLYNQKYCKCAGHSCCASKG